VDTEEQQHQISSEDRTKSFLGKILTLSKTEKVFMSLERIIGNLLTMFSAGSETTYNVLIVCLYEIAIDKGTLQQELYEEIRTLFGSSDNTEDDNAMTNNTIEYDDLQTGLPRLRSLMYEILRLKGPTPILGAESVTDEVYIDGYQQPTDTQFILLSRYASTIEEDTGTDDDENEHENRSKIIDDSKRSVPKGPMNSPVDIFCPRRWLLVNNDNDNETETTEEETTTDTNKTRSKSTTPSTSKLSVLKPTFKSGFRSFGTSLRVCPGRELAEMEVLVLLSYVLRKFDLRVKHQHPPLQFVTRIAQTPDSPVELVLQLRK